MKNNQWLKILGCLLVCLTFFASGVSAGSMRRNINATECKDVFLKYNGSDFMAKDANEQVVYPLIVNGSTYLPVRAVAAITGLKVDWDGNTKTVLLSSSDYMPEDEDGYLEEQEINDTKADANPIALDGGKIKGRVGATLSQGLDENDYYKFSVQENGIIDIILSTDPDAYLSMQVIDADDTSIAYDSSVNEAGDFHFKLGLSVGHYYIILNHGNSESTYKLDTSFQATPDDQEDDYEVSSVKPQSFSGNSLSLTGSIGSNSDYADHYVLTGVNSTSLSVTLDWLGNEFEQISLMLYDANDESLVYDQNEDYVGDRFFDLGSRQLSISSNEVIEKIVIEIVPSKMTEYCDVYTINLSK